MIRHRTPMQITPPALPLTSTAFAAALRTGHGRAMQHVAKYGSAGLDDYIIEACVCCVSYDPQCEAERAPWLFSIVDRARLNEAVTRAIEALVDEPPPEDHRDMDQRCAMLKQLAISGSNDARRALYASLTRLSYTADVIGAHEIIALDGELGLIYVAKQLGRWVRDDPDFWVDDFIIELFDRSSGDLGGLVILEREAQVDPEIASYLAGVRKSRACVCDSTNRFGRTSYSGADIIALVESNPRDPCHWFRGWGARAGAAERETVFAALLASDEPEHVKRLFRCFGRTGVPRHHNRMLQWIAHPDKQIRWAAVRAVAPVMHGELRQTAKQLIADGDIANGVALLVNNFEMGDFALCASHLTCLDDVDETHQLVGELLDLCETHPGEEALACLLYVYELSPCATCRRRAVRTMIDSQTAPEWVLMESAFDADPETRTLVGEH